MVKIAIDAMGAEKGLEIIVNGAKKALEHLDKSDELILVGNYNLKKLISDEMNFVFAPDVFSMNDNPITELRKKKKSSIMIAANLVKNGNADILFSPGNTGASVVASVLKNRLDERFKNYPLATTIPTIIKNKYTILLDVGGSYPDVQKGLEYNTQVLFDFAIAGNAFYKSLFNNKPKIGLLNVGEESYKGPSEIKECAKALKNSNLNYIGFVEGNDIMTGDVDVIVCNGYTGNITLKAIEGTASTIKNVLKEGVPDIRDFNKTIESIKTNFDFIRDNNIKGLIENLKKIDVKINKTIGSYLAIPWGVFKSLKNRLNYEKYGGAYLLGIEKPTVIGHGASSEKAIESAIYFTKNCYNLSKEINDNILKQLNN